MTENKSAATPANMKKITLDDNLAMREELLSEICNGIHNEMGNDLIAVKNFIGRALDQEMSDEARNNINSALEVLTKVYEYKQDLEKKLYPNTLSIGSFTGSIESLFIQMSNQHQHKDISRPNIKEEVAKKLDELDKSYRLPIYRVMQELLLNAIKYGGDYVTCLFNIKGNELMMTILDTGQGFDIKTIKQGHGTTLIREYTKSLGGTITYYYNEKIKLMTATLRFRCEIEELA